MPRYVVDPGLAIEAAVRQEVLGHGGVWFNGRVLSSTELRALAAQPTASLYLNSETHGKRIFESAEK